MCFAALCNAHMTNPGTLVLDQPIAGVALLVSNSSAVSLWISPILSQFG
jgi:hypothetical protein